MLKKILFNFLLIFILCLSGCEEFYSFEAKKLNKKAEELVEESKIITDIDEKIILLSSALKKIEKIQKRYPKTKVARLHIKVKKINNLNDIKKIDIYTSHHTHYVIGTGANDPQKMDPNASRETLDH